MDELEVCVEKLPAWVIDIDAAAKKVNIAEEKADWEKPSIYHVPEFAKYHHPNAFTPQVFSFGPFHHGEKHLEANESHKHRALAHFLHRSGKESGPFISKLRCILKQLQDSYQGLEERWKENPNEFLRMMLLDGCFMIEVLRQKEFSADYATNDPIFSLQMIPLRKPYIKRDMLLLENQLPLLVLKALLEVEGIGQTDDQYINDLVLTFCRGENFKAELQQIERSSATLRVSKQANKQPIERMPCESPKLARHPLELYRSSLLQVCCERKVDIVRSTSGVTDQVIENAVELRESFGVTDQVIENTVKHRESSRVTGQVIENAVELRESGVRFTINQTESLCDINFDLKTGRLELPVVPVHDGTEHLFLNMIAYEQIHVGAGCEITSYVTFMDSLIDTKEDVKLLQKKKIITNALGSHQAVAELFNRLARETANDPNNDVYNKVRNDLNTYYEKRGHRWLASLRHEYLHNPWKVISIAAASFVILLTVIQTVYSMLQVHLK